MPGKNFINTYEETRKALEEVDANQNETDLDEKTQKTLEDIVLNGPSCRTRCGVEQIKRPALEPVVVPPGSNCRPEVVSNRSSCRTRCGVERIKRPALGPVVVPPGSNCRPDVVSSGSSKVKPKNPKEMESVAKKVVDKIETVEKKDERITNEKFSEHIGRRGMVLRSILMSSPRRSSKTLNPGD